MPAPRTDGHAPLLWLAAPLVWGIILARVLGATVPPVALAATGLAVAACACVLTLRERWFVRPVWGFLIIVSGALLAWACALHREPPALPPESFTPREAEVALKIDRVFQTGKKFPRLSGLATVSEAPRLQPYLHGQPIAFSLWAEDIDRGEALPGATIRARGKVTRLNPDDDLNGFEQYLVQSGYVLQIGQGDALQIEHTASGFRRWCHHMNRRINTALHAGAETAGEQALAGVAAAMFLGDKGELARSQKETFIASGTMHLFAVSGLHVGIIAGAFALILRLLRVPAPTAAALGLALLLLYVQIIGAPPSALRAFLMVAFYWGAQLFRRRPAPFSALLGSALAVLLIDPRQLFSAGFQLSYLVVAALLLYAAPLSEWAMARLDPYRLIPADSLSRFQRLLRYLLKILCASLAVSVAAFIFASPLTIEYFNIFAPGAVLLNLILIPLATIVIVGALASAIIGLAAIPALGAIVNAAIRPVIWEMWAVVSSSITLPGGFWQAGFRAEWVAPTASLALLLSLLAVSRWARHHPVAYLIPPAILTPVLVFGAEFAKL
ncbi:ComEC/Rec2 family competence protein [Ruficoccus sp. ZRK36]|uniref:ComEC/Rec2 family competence protein n=1 Tax=Ruficoccus sp. ZRK36 TaxID=2866311 RepID=UPI001C72DAAC|nr:ComEC/Rec2 family competence protein [Ruficoccus sp. ZRK36]QYY34410.1 ComEC/Rec2 family competence protein [Ruficoccus sp. ZRK36]